MSSRTLSIRFSAALGLLVLVNCATFYIAHNVMETAEAVSREDAVLDGVREILISLSDAEAARRAYAITRDPQHLQYFQAMIKKTDEQLEAMRKSKLDDLGLVQKMAMADELVDKAITSLSESIAKGELSPAAQADLINREEVQFLEVRRLLGDELGQEEKRLRDAENSTQKTNYHGIQFAMAVGTLLSLGLIFAAYVKLNKEISERKRAEESTQVLNKQLQKVNGELEGHLGKLNSVNIELETINQFMTYDLRTPLSVIYGFSSVLIDHYAGVLQPEGLRSLEAIHRNADKMKQMMEDLITFSQANRQLLNASAVDMVELAQEIYKDVDGPKPKAGRQFKLKSLPPAHADPNLIRRAFTHLIANAYKFSRNKEGPSIEIGGRSEKGENIYYVKDNGAGFDMGQAHKLFGVFQRLHTRSEFEGNGIGLAIVKKVIDRHGGRVWAEGKLGQGAVFYFTLPKSDFAAFPAQAAAGRKAA